VRSELLDDARRGIEFVLQVDATELDRSLVYVSHDDSYAFSQLNYGPILHREEDTVVEREREVQWVDIYLVDIGCLLL
jgi:hypothetical protein